MRKTAMRQGNLFIKSGLIGAVLIGVSVIIGLPDGDIKAIHDHMKIRYYGETTAEDFAETYGDDAIPVLLGILKSGDADRYSLGKVCLYLGKMGAQDTLEPMKQVVKRPLPKELGKNQYSDIYSTMVGIAFLGTDDAFKYLKQLATDEYWAKRKTHPTIPHLKRNEAKARKRLRQMALNSIGYVGNEKAKGVLEELRRTEASDMQREVDDALEEVEYRLAGKHLLDRGKYMPIMSGAPD